ncbi:heparinase II/III domain-containing protein [Paenibacillus sp. UNC451MF]|uniref:heparinase II/III domain-containing protein n=1 Tax=Paenibacillus sp. UNC451MF TaxID=1449063 RepID=UPI00048DFC3A|nr:heparinase II/III family protein [Paenibacillus sp. UNC451MF]
MEDRGFYQLASAYHLNYEPIVHHRHISLVNDRFVVIADRVEGMEKHSVQRYFHLDFTDVQEAAGGIIAASDIANLAIFTSEQDRVDILPGRLSDRNDVARPSTRVKFHGRYSGSKNFLTVLVPYKGELPDIQIKELMNGVFVARSVIMLQLKSVIW